MEPQLETWHRFFHASLTKRLPPQTFQNLVKACSLKTEGVPAGRSLASALLAESRRTGLQQADPRVPLYINELLDLELCSAADVLLSLLPPPALHSPPPPPPPPAPPAPPQPRQRQQQQPQSSSSPSPSLGLGGGGEARENFEEGKGGGMTMMMMMMMMRELRPEMEGVLRPSVEAMVLETLSVKVEEGLVLKTKGDVGELLRACVVWMERVPGSVALGYLISATLGSALAGGVLGLPSMKETKSSFSRCLSVLISHLSRTNIQLATALDYWQKQHDLRDEVVTGQNLELLDGVDLSAMAFQQSVMDTPTVHTRAGLYIYLNAMLNGRPLFDDLHVIGYLNAKYKDDVQALVTDLILASFDILASAMYRSETTESTSNLLRSFLVNKLPVFLTNYAAMMFENLTVRNCIQQALTRVDPAAFPPSYSQMFDPLGTTGMLSEARQEFLFACALHQLIEEKDIEGLLGDVPMQSLPESGRYIKSGLVAQCSSNPAKIEEFIAELDNMEGNAGEIVAALLEIINTLCINNDTMTLKRVCVALCRKPQALDVIMLFTESATFMSPLCHVLDNWENHEDQGEQQPVYAEFGSILLLIIFAKHRFNMQACDLGIEGPNSFVLTYIKKASMARSPDELTEHEDVVLRGWIRGLFEAEGINDDLMSMCSPKDFHLLVATLFDQSLKAFHAQVLTPETSKSGFEYLHEPFLLPSLAAGLDWFAQHIWSLSDPNPSLTPSTYILGTLMRPRSLSPESSVLFSLVLSIVGKPLEDALSYTQRQHPHRAGLPSLLDTLKQHLSCDPLKHHVQRQRHEAAFLVDLESWSVAPGGGLVAALKATIRALVAWSTNTTSYITIPPYTHRQLLETLRILGAKQVLSHLIDEILSHHPSPSSSNSTSPPGPSPTRLEICTDIITTLICAPSSPSFSPTKPHPTTFLSSNSPPPPPNTTSAAAAATIAPNHQLTLRDALSYEFEQSYDLSKQDLRRAETIVRLHRQVEVLLGRNSVVVGGETVGEDGNGGVVTVTGVGVDRAGGMGGGMGVVENIDDVLVQAEDRFLSADVGFLGGL